MIVTVVKHPNYGAARGTPGNTVISVYLDLLCPWTPARDLIYNSYTFRNAPGEWAGYSEEERTLVLDYLTEGIFRSYQRRVERYYNDRGELAPWQKRDRQNEDVLRVRAALRPPRWENFGGRVIFGAPVQAPPVEPDQH